MINEYTEKVINDNYDKMWCVKCYCNVYKKNEKWGYVDNGVWRYLSWHEIELNSLLENKSFEEIVNSLPRFYTKKCNTCKRIVDIKDIDYPEQVMEYEEGWRVICWPCSCRNEPEKLTRHKQIVKQLAERDPCGC
jgi:hypothetical protein